MRPIVNHLGIPHPFLARFERFPRIGDSVCRTEQCAAPSPAKVVDGNFEFAMHKYRVVECCPGQKLLLEGGVGRYHWARVLNESPQVGNLLTGSRPHLGFGLLLCSRSALTFRVVFESINCDDPAFNVGWVGEPPSASQGSHHVPTHRRDA